MECSRSIPWVWRPSRVCTDKSESSLEPTEVRDGKTTTHDIDGLAANQIPDFHGNGVALVTMFVDEVGIGHETAAGAEALYVHTERVGKIECEWRVNHSREVRQIPSAEQWRI